MYIPIFAIILLSIAISVLITLFAIKSKFAQQAKKNILDLENQIILIKEENIRFTIDLSIKKEESINLQNQLEEQKKSLEVLTKQMKLEFENISKNLLEEQREKFKLQSDETLTHITTPLRQNINEFKEKVEQLHKHQEIKTELLERNIEKNTKTTQELVNAFSKDKKLQGNWGENHLKLALNQIGLIEGREYQTQVNVKEHNSTTSYFLDVLIKLPDNKHLIIDAKVSLTNFMKMNNTTSSEEQQQYKKEFIKNVKDQILNLSSKNYYNTKLPDGAALKTPEFVFMFVPSEAAFAFIINEDPTLFQIGFKEKVIICSPTTLFGYLMTVASMWSAVKQNENIIAIKNIATKLIDRMNSFNKEFLKAEQQVVTIQNTLSSIRTKMEGKQGIAPLTKQIDKLGIKNNLFPDTEELEEPKLIEEPF